MFYFIADRRPRLQAKVLTFPVTASGGTGISVDLADVVGNSLLSGLELLRANPGGVAAPRNGPPSHLRHEMGPSESIYSRVPILIK